MSEWTVLSCGELADSGVLRIEDGNHGEYRPRPDEFTEEGVAFIRAADLVDGVVDFVGAGKINGEARRRIRKGVGEPGDVLLSHKGTVGKVAVVPVDAPEFVCSPQTTFWRTLDSDRLDGRFLGFYLQSPKFVAQLDSRKAESDMAPYVSLTEQRKFILEVPPTQVQRAIAQILGALDDKIAANRKLAQTVDELTCVLFADAVLDVAPSERTFGDVVTVSGGGTPSTKVEEYWDGEIGWATPTDVTALGAPYLFSTARTITQPGLDNCSSSLYPPGSILMTSRATIGAFAVAKVPVAVNQGFIVASTSDEALRWWIFHEMRSRVPEFLSYANGATFLELSRGKFKQLRVRLPERSVIDRFGQDVSTLHASAIEAMKEIDSLILIRDALLPRLMSGELRVRDAERQVEEVL